MKITMTKYLFAIAMSSFAFSQADAACGKFDVSKGDVKISRSGKVSPAPEGSQVCSGDKVMAGPASRAKITMDDGNVLNVLPETEIILEKYEYNPTENKKKVLLNVLKGKVRTATAKENMYNDKADDGQANTFQVKTKSAVAGVRGTDFMSGYNPSTKKAEFVTFKGKVDVGSVGANGKISNIVQVTAGMVSGVPLGEKPEMPKPLPAAELKQLNLDTTASTSNPNAGGNSAAVRENGDPNNSTDKGANGNGNGESGRSPASAGNETNGPTGSGPTGSGPTGSGPAGSGPAGSGPTVGGPTVGGPTVGGPAVGGPLDPKSAGPIGGLPPPPPPPPPPQLPLFGGCPGGICGAPPPIATPPAICTTCIQQGPAKLKVNINY